MTDVPVFVNDLQAGCLLCSRQCAAVGCCFGGATGAVESDQLVCIGLCESGGAIGKVGTRGVGHVEHKITLATQAHGPDQHGAPVGGVGAEIRVTGVLNAAVQIYVARHGGAIDVKLVLIVVLRVGQQRQCRYRSTGYVSKFFTAIQGCKTMQHSIISPHIQHAGACSVGAHKGTVAFEQIVGGRRPGVPHVRIDDIALDAHALAERFGRCVA